MCERKREFRKLYDRLGLSAAEVAVIIDKKVPTVRQYLSVGAHNRIPGDDVLATVRAAWRERAHLKLAEIVDHLRDEGVEIDWASLEESGPVKRTFWRPSFLGTAASVTRRRPLGLSARRD